MLPCSPSSLGLQAQAKHNLEEVSKRCVKGERERSSKTTRNFIMFIQPILSMSSRDLPEKKKGI
jgi:hypothetical protein